MYEAVKGNVQHFLLDDTKRRLYQDWLNDISEIQLCKNYFDPIYKGPHRPDVEVCLRSLAKEERLERIRLSLRVKQLERELRQARLDLATAQYQLRRAA